MKNEEVLRLVEALRRERRVDRETIFRGLEAAILAAARRRFSDPDAVQVRIDRETGEVQLLYRGEPHSPEELGRIAAHISRQMLMQKIREAERERLYDEFAHRVGELVQGTVTRLDRSVVAVDLGGIEAILPRSEQIPRERFRVGRPVRAIIKEVRRDNSRLRIVLSRTHPDFIRRLFEREVPEVAEGVIQIKGIVREPGLRAKVAVTSTDSRIDCVGACVGVRGARIKNVLDELGSEKIDIVRWNEQPQQYIAAALQPAQVREVMLFPLLGRAIVVVSEDQLSQAIGHQGLNVRLASRLTGWNIEIMTEEELEAELQRALIRFTSLPGVTSDMADRLIEQGILSYGDLLALPVDEVAQLLEVPIDQAQAILDVARQKYMAGEDPAEVQEIPEAEQPARAEQVQATEHAAEQDVQDTQEASMTESAAATTPTDTGLESPEETEGENSSEEKPTSSETVSEPTEPQPESHEQEAQPS